MCPECLQYETRYEYDQDGKHYSWEQTIVGHTLASELNRREHDFLRGHSDR